MAIRSAYFDSTVALGKFRRRLQTVIQRVSWAYLVLLLALWGFVAWQGDQSWLGTLVLFGPIWVAIVPAAVLIPVALFIRRRSLGLLFIGVAIAAFPIMGFCLPWRTYLHHPSGGQHIRLLTCNVNRTTLNQSALAALVDEAAPDVIVLQEWSSELQRPSFIDKSWHYRQDGELVIASRYPIEKVEDFTNPHWNGWGGAVVRYDLAAPLGALHLFNVHLASPHNQFQAIIDGKPTGDHLLEVHLEVRREESQLIRQLAGRYDGGAIIAGDFNSIAEGSIYRQSWTHFSDAFTCAGFGVGHTYFGEGASVRIDHVLAGSAWRFTHCRIGPDVGSPHRPVIAELEWVGVRGERKN